jgi:hypothetical protein
MQINILNINKNKPNPRCNLKSFVTISYLVFWHMTKIVDNFNISIKPRRLKTALFNMVINDL